MGVYFPKCAPRTKLPASDIPQLGTTCRGYGLQVMMTIPPSGSLYAGVTNNAIITGLPGVELVFSLVSRTMLRGPWVVALPMLRSDAM